MTKTITATQVQAGDYVTGDRYYRSGTMHLQVTAVERKDIETVDGDTVEMIVLAGLQAPYDVPRRISYAGTDMVIVRAS